MVFLWRSSSWAYKWFLQYNLQWSSYLCKSLVSFCVSTILSVRTLVGLDQVYPTALFELNLFPQGSVSRFSYIPYLGFWKIAALWRNRQAKGHFIQALEVTRLTWLVALGDRWLFLYLWEFLLPLRCWPQVLGLLMGFTHDVAYALPELSNVLLVFLPKAQPLN